MGPAGRRGPLSSLGIIDRVVYPSFEPMVTLAAAAGVTQRIRLMTSILLAPARNAGILAKQAASLGALSGGRLTLGLGVGAREDDFLAAPALFHDRGARFQEQLATMRRIWAGEPAAPGAAPRAQPPARAGRRCSSAATWRLRCGGWPAGARASSPAGCRRTRPAGSTT
ncbi:MAG TPA: LLM class flavin-dependent oxidoreductase [Dehalococcoidia bacterium]